MKEHETKELERMEKLAAEIERNPLTKKFREEEARETLIKRHEAADRIEALRDKAKRFVAMQTEIDAMVERLIDKDRERQEQQAEIAKKRGALMRARLDIESDIAQQEKFIYSCYSPEIDDAIAWFRDRHETLLKKKPDSQTNETGTNVFTMVKNFVTFNNCNAITDALTYCLAAIRELESMKLTPALDVNRIKTMMKGIPKTDEMEEFIGEKPFLRINSDARSLLKSDSQMDWELGKLNEKFEKVMGRL